MTLETTLSVREVQRRLAERLVPAAGLSDTIFRNMEALSNPKAEKPEGIRFVGTVSADGFELVRWVPYRNSFRPRLHGRLRASGDGTIVEVRVDSIGVWISSAVALLVVVFLAWLFLVGLEFSLRRELLIPFGICAGVALAFLVGPRIETNKAKRGLAQVISANSNDV